MRHFDYFENGGPAPSTCLSCGRNKQLFNLGRDLPVAGGMAQLCIICVKEIAAVVGYEEALPLKLDINDLKSQLAAREAELATVPNHVEELINGIRSSVTDFIFAVSFSDVSNEQEAVSSAPSSTDGADEAGETAPRERKAPKQSSVN